MSDNTHNRPRTMRGVRLTDEQWAALLDIKRVYGVTPAELMRRGVDLVVAQYQGWAKQANKT